MTQDIKVFSVSEYIEFLNLFFAEQEHRVLGEISELKFAQKGHVYFTIKDKNGDAVLDCKIWKNIYDLCGVKLEEGLEVIITGYASIYPKNGRLSLIANAIELVGEGVLKKQYDALKKKLENEGFFDLARKREIPEFAQKIGVITSKNGAVINDFLNNLGRFGFQVIMIDSLVEGQIAVKDLLNSVKTMRKQKIDVLVIIRGGGSLESLQAFNNETLVRAIIDFPVPIIAGIGHDKDVPLLALTADIMASTPTAAAHILNESWERACVKLQQIPYLLNRMSQEFKRIRAALDTARSSAISQTANQIDYLKEKIISAERIFKSNDPARQLKLGYAIVRHNGKILRSVQKVDVGEDILTSLSDGVIESKIKKIK